MWPRVSMKKPETLLPPSAVDPDTATVARSTRPVRSATSRLNRASSPALGIDGLLVGVRPRRLAAELPREPRVEAVCRFCEPAAGIGELARVERIGRHFPRGDD